MASVTDGTGQNIYRSYSQLSNPYLDQPETNTGMPVSFGGANEGTTIAGAPANATPSAMKTSIPGNTATSNALTGGTAIADWTSLDPLQTAANVARRGGSTWGAPTGAAAGGMTGAKIGSIIPGVGSLIGAGVGALVGGIKGMFNKRAASAPTDFATTDATKIIQDGYRAYLGREASMGEIQTHLTNIGWKPGNSWVGQNGLSYILQALQNSEEGQAHALNPNAGLNQPAAGAPASSAPKGVMVDPAAISARVTELFQSSKGRPPTADELKYWIGKGTTPEEYSDHKIRVGWNPYWEARLVTGSASADPRLAGDVGVVGYGYEDQNRGAGGSGGSLGGQLANASPYMQDIYGMLGQDQAAPGSIPFVDFRTVGAMDTNKLLANIMAQLNAGRAGG